MHDPVEGTPERDYRDEFPLAPGLIYLNHAAVSPWPRRTAEAVQRFAAENMSEGSRRYPRWMETETRVRTQCRDLLNAPSADDIALLKNTSEALSVVAYGLDWRVGDNVVISAHEFPSNRIVWQSLHARGVETRFRPEPRTFARARAGVRHRRPHPGALGQLGALCKRAAARP